MNQLLHLCFRHQRYACLAALLLSGTSVMTQAQTQPPFIVLNAASYGAQAASSNEANRRTLAPDTIAAAFGTFTTQNGQAFFASTATLPTTLGGVRLRVNGVDAGLFFVSPAQINFAVPPNLADSANATMVVINSNNAQVTGGCFNSGSNSQCIIARSSPGIFSIKATGEGAAAGLTTKDAVTFTPTYKADLSPADVDAGTTASPTALVLYGTGIRRIPAANPNDANGVAESISLTLQGVPLNVLFAGPAPGFTGLDQINAILPPEAAGLGIVKLVVQAKPPLATPFLSNAVDLRIGGLLPPIRVNSPIAFDQTINGELTTDDQIQMLNDGTGRTYFFDVYTFRTTQPNQTILVDMRRDISTAGNQLNSALLLYRVVGNNLDQLGEDGDIETLGNGNPVETNNAIMLMVLPLAGDYAIFTTSSNVQPNGVGKYSLKLSAGPIRQLTYGQSLTNETIAATDIRNSSNVLFDAYYFQGTQGERVDVRTTSASYISLLILHQNGSFAPQGWVGDAGSIGGQARVAPASGLPDTGIYIILVTPFEINKTGTYSLSLNRVTALGEEAMQSRDEDATPARKLGERFANSRAVTRTIEE